MDEELVMGFLPRARVVLQGSVWIEVVSMFRPFAMTVRVASRCGAYALQQEGGRLVVGILGNELAREGLLEDALAQPLGPLQTCLDGFLGLPNDG